MNDRDTAIEMCHLDQHAWEAEYYGDRCRVCGLFIPDGHGWWMYGDDEYNWDEETDDD
jgi:hypothetical protein